MFHLYGLLKGLKVTLQNFIRPPFTIQYPDRNVGILAASKHLNISPLQFIFRMPKDAMKAAIFLYPIPERVPQSPRFRGNDFAWYEERCTGCASCAKYCPLGIIEIVTHPGGFDEQQGESYAIDVFDIDIGRCMFCGLCVEACPYDALHMGTRFERSNYSRVDLVITKEELNASIKNPSSWYRQQFEEHGYNPYEKALKDHHSAGRHEKPSEKELKQRWVDRR